MKKYLLIVIAVVVGAAATAQQKRLKLALFAPLYLDSAFDAGNNYTFNKSFPKFLNPGLEFYQGAQAALDSLSRAGAPLEVFVYDSKAKGKTIAQQLAAPELKDVGLIVGHANTTEVRTLADAALQRKIPFISATLPNDAGITANPYYVILNSTLRTHCEGLYKYLQRSYPGQKVIVLRKSGVQEGQIRDYLQEASRTATGPQVKIQYEEFTPDVNPARLSAMMDSTKRNIFIAGSLDEAFGTRMLNTLSALASTYPTTVFGMPTWDNFNLTKPEYNSLEIIFSTPFNYSRPTAIGNQLAAQFTARTAGRPTDMYYRGYETILRFALLLLDTETDLSSNLTRKGAYIFTAFDVQPVFLNKQAMQLDYFENKKLYFVRTANGVRSVQ